MSRTHRLFDILQMLRRHRGPVSGEILAREAGISLRTLYRDIAALQAMGADIEGAPGFGYILKPGFMLPPLMFSETEIAALTLGIKWVAKRTDDELGQAAREALSKIAAVLPADLQHHINDDALIVGHGWERPQAVSLEFLRKALKSEHKLKINYKDQKGRTSQRIIWPVMLGFFETTRVLVAWCEMRADFRHFRTDRIEAAELLPDRPAKRRRALVQQWRTMLTESDKGMAHKNAPTRNEESPMTKELIFYTNPQSRAAIVHWALEEIGCAYTVKVLDYDTTMKAPDYLTINPMGKVPAIKHGDTIVTEVAAILAYLADTFPEAGLAPDVSERGDYYRWIFFTADCLLNAVNNNMRGCNPAPEQYVQVGYGCYEHVLDTVSGLVKDKTTIASDTFTMADLLLASYLDFFMKFDMIEKRPEFEAYCAPHIARPANKCAQQAVAKLMNEKSFATT